MELASAHINYILYVKPCVDPKLEWFSNSYTSAVSFFRQKD